MLDGKKRNGEYIMTNTISESTVTLAEFCAAAEEVANSLCETVEASRAAGNAVALQRDIVMIETFNRLGISVNLTVDGKTEKTAGRDIPVDFGGLYTFLASQGAFKNFDTVRGPHGGVVRRSTADIVAAKAKASRDNHKKNKPSAAERLEQLKA